MVIAELFIFSTDISLVLVTVAIRIRGGVVAVLVVVVFVVIFLIHELILRQALLHICERL